MMHRDEQKRERGSALLIAMIALALLLAVGFIMTFSTMAETRIDGNFRLHKQSYYASHAGLEEVRDRMRLNSHTPGGLSDLLPQGIPGAASSALYVINPAGGETVNPADTANKYFDFEFCHEYDPNAPIGQKCATAPTTANWELTTQNSLQTPQTTGQPLAYKWVRINLKTDRVAQPYCVEGPCSAANLDNRVCWDGTEEVLAPDATTTCGALNMHPVYMLSSYSSSLGARTLSRYEVASVAIRPPGALNLESQQSAPSFNDSSNGTGDQIPFTNIDGRPRDINGNLLPPGTSGCEATPPIATDGSSSTSSLQSALDDLRQRIVQRANAFCGANGNSTSCTPGLAWVNSNFPENNNSSNCSASTPTCYKNLNLSAPQLDAQTPLVGPVSAPFIGATGNVDSLISQVGANTLQSQISTINQVVSDAAGQPNFFTIPNSTISSPVTYGSVDNPAVVVAGDSGGLEIQANVTGYGILVVPNNFRIDSATFQWTGIVLVEPPSGEFRLDNGANGFINGALVMQASSTTNVRTSDSDSRNFTISYSCDAIDLAFSAEPLKIISYSEIAY
ncbi:MAG TPA: hypothetical protein VFP59_13160 [Candidatus Angelobacter sp.]|nr:hypothetical protein [Candidatus Angelobacter sp.]